MTTAVKNMENPIPTGVIEVIISDGQKMVFANRLTGNMMLDVDEPEGLVYFDAKGKMRKPVNENEEKIQRRANRLYKNRIVHRLLINPIMTEEQFLNMLSNDIGKCMIALKDVIG